MILAFNKENLEKRDFIRKIECGVKVSTIRSDKAGKWVRGRSIQMYAKGPRNGGKMFAESYAKAVYRISIDPITNSVVIKYPNSDKTLYRCVNDIDQLNILAISDGFESWEDMKSFFKEPFVGKIIYWDLKSMKFVQGYDYEKSSN